MEHPDRPGRDETAAIDDSSKLTERLEAPKGDQPAIRRIAEAELADHAKPTRPADPSPESEVTALARWQDELDQSVLATLEKKFSVDIDGERLTEARAHPTRFESTPDYQRGLASAYPGEADRHRIVGDLRDDIDPHVDSNGPELPRTVTHERVHQLSNPEFRHEVGRGLNEGTTEHIARQTTSGVHIAGIPEGYPEEERIAGMIEARVGPELERAYFNGDLGAVRREFDGQLGAGALDNVVELIRGGKLNEAAELIKGKRPPPVEVDEQT